MGGSYLVGTCVSGSNCYISCHWIVALSFLGFGAFVGWLHGYHVAKQEFKTSGKTLTEDGGSEEDTGGE